MIKCGEIKINVKLDIDDHELKYVVHGQLLILIIAISL